MSASENAQWCPSPPHHQGCFLLGPQDSCELVPAVPSPPPRNPRRHTRPRSHSPHFASPAPMPTHPPPQSIEMRRPAPTLPPFVLAVSFLHICMILVTQHALRVPVSKRISSHLYVLSSVSVVPISCAEQSLDFPFSSAFLIGGTGCLYYRSSAPSISAWRFVRIPWLPPHSIPLPTLRSTKPSPKKHSPATRR